jgi:hypothetical protein
MSPRDPKTVAEAIRNLWVSRVQYGRVSAVVRQYGISRPALYRMEGRFLESIGHRRRHRTPTCLSGQREGLHGEELARLKSEKAQLQAQVDELRDEKLRTLRRTQFWLIGLGLPARVIARLLRECFQVRSNRTDILRLTQQYARRATQLMQEYFWPAAQDVDLDEIFIEGLPLLIAAEPRGMAILKTSLEPERTVTAWGAFLRDLPHLRRTTSDRGQAIRGAVARLGIPAVQSDIFHPIMLWRDELAVMEARCYALIEQEDLLHQRLAKTRRRGRDCRAHAARLYRVAKRTREAIACFDELDAAVQLARHALRLTTAQGTFNSPAQARADLQFAKTWIQAHLPAGWSKVKRSLDDEVLLTFLAELNTALPSLCVHAPTPEDRHHVLVTLARLWEDQAQRRYRAKPVRIPEPILQQLQSRCANLPEVQRQLFHLLDHLHRASSGVECINSRVGFYRYSKRRFNGDFANLIAMWHNLSPFEDGKRAGESPAKILQIPLPSHDLFDLFNVA